MALQLKKNFPEFEMVEGEFKGVKFVHNRRYEENGIPKKMRDKFTTCRPLKPSKTKK